MGRRTAVGGSAVVECPLAPAAVSATRAAGAAGTAAESSAAAGVAAAALPGPAAVGKVLVTPSCTAGMQARVIIAAVRESLVQGAFVMV